jgi:hypothetical protein
VYEEIDKINRDSLLNTPTEDLVNTLLNRFSVCTPVLAVDQVDLQHDEIEIDVSQDYNRMIRDRSQSFYVKGTRYSFTIPFTGDEALFDCQPSTFSFNPPRGHVESGRLGLTYERIDHDANSLKNVYERDVAQINTCLGYMANDVNAFNSNFSNNIRQHVEQRKQRLLKDAGVAASLGINLRKREDTLLTYVVPVTRKPLPITRPSANKPFTPEPELSLLEYDHILGIISNMVSVIEQSPDAFANMKEEHLRTHFLVQLNSQYEGRATGETFNGAGKTDILIKEGTSNVFIAECKFWKSPTQLSQAIDQLLGYATWRDGKLALLVFNRNRKFSDVLAQIPQVVKSHPAYKREVPCTVKGGFRYILSRQDDPLREVLVTVMVFEVPK